MCTCKQKKASELSSAEDFLDYLDIPYDPHVVSVNRLHILKRYHDYLGRAGVTASLEECEGRQQHRECLVNAYQDFVGSSAQEQKVFPVFQRGEGKAFVSISKIER